MKEAKIYKCEFCGAEFRQKENCEKHEKSERKYIKNPPYDITLNFANQKPMWKTKKIDELNFSFVDKSPKFLSDVNGIRFYIFCRESEIRQKKRKLLEYAQQFLTEILGKIDLMKKEVANDRR